VDGEVWPSGGLGGGGVVDEGKRFPESSGRLEKKREKSKKKKKGTMDISPFCQPYTVRRNRFAKYFIKTAPVPRKEPLHQRSRRRGCFEWSRSPPKHARGCLLV
jgi:hypothetical protein